jgi:hypothetical protein
MPTTRSAPDLVSIASSCSRAIPIVFMPPVFAAAAPASVSSTTMQSTGATASAAAAARRIPGAGFPATSCPQTFAAKHSTGLVRCICAAPVAGFASRSIFSIMALAFFEEEAAASRTSRLRSAVISRKASGEGQEGSFLN